MSKHSSTELTVAVNDNEHGTTIQTQYGVRLPNGEHRWGAVEGGGRRVNLQGMLDPKTREADRAIWRQHWEDYLQSRAKDANINPDEYEEQHSFVKRQVILVTTAPEGA